jgi:hypothetical protein
MSVLTIDRVKELLSYDPETGLLAWRVNVGKRTRAGEVAGCLRKDGRVVVRLDYQLHYAYRLVWAIVHGRWPAEMIDHINGDPSDNRLVNLREASASLNNQNARKARTKSKTGLLGASPAGCPGEIGRFVAYIGSGSVRKNLGYFDTPEEAHAAYVAAKRQLHPGCTL